MTLFQFNCPHTFLSQVLSVSPEHPVLFLMLRQVQCERLLLSGAGNCVPPAVLDQLSAAVMANHTSVSAWHVSTFSISLRRAWCQIDFMVKVNVNVHLAMLYVFHFKCCIFGCPCFTHFIKSHRKFSMKPTNVFIRYIGRRFNKVYSLLIWSCCLSVVGRSVPFSGSAGSGLCGI